MVFTPSFSYVLVLVLRERKRHFWNTFFLSPPVFPSRQAASPLLLFCNICLVVYQFSESVRLLLADEVSTLLSDLVARSARLCVLGTWGTVWRWPLTPIKGSTALFGSYQFNQLAHSCFFTIHDMILSLPACLSEHTALPTRCSLTLSLAPASGLTQRTIHSRHDSHFTENFLHAEREGSK